MVCQKACKQGRNDIKVKVNIQKPYPYIFLHYSCTLVEHCCLNKSRNEEGKKERRKKTKNGTFATAHFCI